MLTYRTITTQTEYLDNAWVLLRQLESAEYGVYLDSQGYASIGVGFNLTVRNIRNAVYSGLDFADPVVLRDSGDEAIAVLEEYYMGQLTTLLTSGSTQLQLDNIMQLRAIDTGYDGTSIVRRSSFTFSPANTGLIEMRGVFDAIHTIYDNYIDSRIGTVPLSDERVALFSLAYNTPSLLGSGLRNAISTGDRAEAWFEIRYQSNKEIGVPFDTRYGLQKRRYLESNLFSIYNEVPIEDDYLAAYRMFARHRDDSIYSQNGMIAYDTQFSGALALATGENSGVQILKDEFNEAFIFLGDKYATDTGITIDWRDVQVAEESGGTLNGTKRTGNTFGTNEDQSDLLIGSDANDTLNGLDGRDVLIGGMGNDTLDGDLGNDYLNGGLGNDTLNGGAGSDLYIYRVGDGNDVISDTDKQGYIRYARGEATTVLSGGKSDTESGGTYYSGDRSISYQWSGVDGSSLIIRMQGNDGSITVNDFYNNANNLGIKLSTKGCTGNCGPGPGGPGGGGAGAAGAAGTRTSMADPLALDLDGDGIETVALVDSTAYFDFNADINATKTGWIAPDDGWLVWDRNMNGNIDSGRELFGVDTLKRDGSLATDGFNALADEDLNADGVIDASDSVFSNLCIWRDLNQDGINQSGELTTLVNNNIVSITVEPSSQFSWFDNGNRITAAGTYTRSDGTTDIAGISSSTVVNLDLLISTFYARFTDELPLTEQAKALPSLHGTGQVRNLNEAISTLPQLGTLVENYVGQT